MKLLPCSLVRDIATLAYLMLSAKGTPKMLGPIRAGRYQSEFTADERQRAQIVAV